MRLPSFLPSEFSKYEKADSDEELYNMLIENPRELIRFFEFSCDNETWSEQHSEFIGKILSWLTTRFFLSDLPVFYIEHAAKIIQQHIGALKIYLPYDILVNISDREILINSLLWASHSEYFRNLLRKEILEKKQKLIVLDNVPYEVFLKAEEFVTTGNCLDLWKKNQSELLEIMQYAKVWQLRGLLELCEEVLKRYIDRVNVNIMLIMAHHQGFSLLRDACFEFINELNMGVRFEKKLLPDLAFEFLEFQDRSLDLFDELKSYITHLIISGALTAQPIFSKVINQCSNLKGLDISRSSLFTDRLQDIPLSLQELDLSQCYWLNDENLKILILKCPQLTKLTLRGDTQLTYRSWSELYKLRALKSLDVSRCHQITDQDLSMILKACRGLTELNLEGCKKISNKAFFELAQTSQRLMHLNISESVISDGVLSEIASYNRDLLSLALVQCESITQKGIRELIQFCRDLQHLDLRKNSMNENFIDELKKQRPGLTIDY